MKKIAITQHGFTLVEVMVAMTIGLLLMSGVITILTSSHQTYRVNDALARVQENARYAFHILSKDIRMAGYSGCAGNGVPTVNTLNNSADFLWRIGQALEGFEATSATGWTPALPPSGAIPSPLGGRDIIVVRGVDDSPTKVTQQPGGNPPDSADLKVTAGSGFKENDIVLVTDCMASAIFQITHINTSQGMDNLVHNTGNPTTDTPGNYTKALGKDFTKGGELVKISTRSYFIRMAEEWPALYRKVGTNPAEEMVRGIENMQIEYGEDLDENWTVDSYRTADAVTNWGKVVSVRISLLMQSIEDSITSQPQPYTFNGTTTTPTDRRLRQAFTTVVTLRNRVS
ncbi:PilW family protein [Nitrosomonas communis]|uniref:PilW family protein n=1 Tax=Nitrosomonas communis TaxID=44574 RepID=UPI003D26A228